MKMHRRLSAGFAVALVTLVAMAANAAGATLTFNPGGNIELRGPTSFTEGLITVRCNVVLTGMISAAAINKTLGANFGRISTGEFRECGIEGRARMRGETMPWNIVYESIVGTLPNMVTQMHFLVERARFRLEIGTDNCGYRDALPWGLAFNLREREEGRRGAVYSAGLVTSAGLIAFEEGTRGCPAFIGSSWMLAIAPGQAITRA